MNSLKQVQKKSPEDSGDYYVDGLVSTGKQNFPTQY